MSPRTNLPLLTLLVVYFAGCGVVDRLVRSIDHTTDTLHAAVATLDADASQWRVTLEKLVTDLRGQGQRDLADSVQSLANRGIATAGTELRCDVDFVGQRMKQGLKSLLAELQGTPAPASAVPTLCQVVPASVDLNKAPELRGVLTIYGYDFDLGPQDSMRAVLVSSSATRVDVTDALTRPTHYLMTVKLDAVLPFDCASERIELVWNDKTIASIGVVVPVEHELACVNACGATATAEARACSQRCCNFVSEQECVERRCEAECRQRNSTLPDGHPAIGDACSTSGAFFRDCRSECATTLECRANWCADAAPLRARCLAAGEQNRTRCEGHCPLVCAMPVRRSTSD